MPITWFSWQRPHYIDRIFNPDTFLLELESRTIQKRSGLPGTVSLITIATPGAGGGKSFLQTRRLPEQSRHWAPVCDCSRGQRFPTAGDLGAAHPHPSSSRGLGQPGLLSRTRWTGWLTRLLLPVLGAGQPQSKVPADPLGGEACVLFVYRFS